MKINWKHWIVGILLVSIMFLYYQESRENRRYETYLSQELSNKHNALVGNIFTLKAEITPLISDQTNLISNETIVERLYTISKFSQDLDRAIGHFRLAKGFELQNKTSNISSNFAGYFEHNDISTVSSEEKEMLNTLNELLDKWINEISKQYPGITIENQQDINKYNPDPFIKSNNWTQIIMEIDQVSKEYEDIPKNR